MDEDWLGDNNVGLNGLSTKLDNPGVDGDWLGNYDVRWRHDDEPVAKLGSNVGWSMGNGSKTPLAESTETDPADFMV